MAVSEFGMLLCFCFVVLFFSLSLFFFDELLCVLTLSSRMQFFSLIVIIIVKLFKSLYNNFLKYDLNDPFYNPCYPDIFWLVMDLDIWFQCFFPLAICENYPCHGRKSSCCRVLALILCFSFFFSFLFFWSNFNCRL